METKSSTIFIALVFAWAILKVARGFYNLSLHPLSKFPGPSLAKLTTWWKTYIEVVRQESMVDVLAKLHGQYGERAATISLVISLT